MSNLRARLAGKQEFDIKEDLEELVDKYIYDKVIRGMVAETWFISECQEEIEEKGFSAEIEEQITQLAKSVKKAIEVAEEKYNNY